MTDVVSVEIWSDIACPFCYIGKRKFDAAVLESGIPVAVTYRSFELGPNTPEDVSQSHAYLLALKMGVSPDEALAMEQQITQAAQDAGLEFRYDLLKPANTRKAHQVLHLAKTQGKQSELAEKLLAAHFTDGRHVGQIAELVAIGAEVGLDPDEVVRVLESGAYVAEVDADIAQAQALGIRGVPFFVLNGKYGVNGAQEPEQFVAALEQAQQGR